jgi:hypothetical protein
MIEKAERIFKVARNLLVEYLKYEYIFPPIFKIMNDFIETYKWCNKFKNRV